MGEVGEVGQKGTAPSPPILGVQTLQDGGFAESPILSVPVPPRIGGWGATPTLHSLSPHATLLFRPFFVTGPRTH